MGTSGKLERININMSNTIESPKPRPMIMPKPAFLESTTPTSHRDPEADRLRDKANAEFHRIHERIVSRDLSLDTDSRLILLSHQLVNIHDLIQRSFQRRTI